MTENFPQTNDHPALPPVEDMESSYGLPALVRENLSKLRESGEVGTYLMPVYHAALERSTVLSDVVLTPYNSADMTIHGSTGRATPPHSSDSGYPEVAVNATSWDEYADTMRSRPVTVAEIGRKIGIDPSQITPKLFAAFTLGHELGHVEDWRSKGFNPQVIDATYESELDTLPVPGVAAATITAWAVRDPEKAKQYVLDHRVRLAKLGISNVDELVAAQDLGYRSIPSKDVPDRFAVAVITSISAK